MPKQVLFAFEHLLCLGILACLANLSLNKLAVAAPVLVAVGEGGTIARSTDLGKTWLPADSGGIKTLLVGATVAQNSVLIAVGDEGTIARSLDKGATWRAVSIGHS